jgi:DNA (cytosine-5)-methyltransferase 1
VNPVKLCGTMFGLFAGEYELRRHRLFETNFDMYAPSPCVHNGPVVSVFGGHARDRRRKTIGVYGEGTSEGASGKSLGIAVGKEAMGIDWMTAHELSESIPPAYTEHVGRYMMRAVRASRLQEAARSSLPPTSLGCLSESLRVTAWGHGSD